MRNLILHISISLDGYIEDAAKKLDWQMVDSEFETHTMNVLKSIDGMMFGRRAYQLLADYWPKAEENPAGAAEPQNPGLHVEIAKMMNELPKYVVSETLEKAEWNNSQIISQNVAVNILKLKKEPGKDIALFAGAGLASTCMRNNLIDEFHLIVHPVLLGEGTPLFQENYDKAQLKLCEVKKFASGVMVLSYQKYKGGELFVKFSYTL